MNRSPLPSWLVTLLAVAAILVSSVACSTTWHEARSGTGFISYTLCAGVFVSKLARFGISDHDGVSRLVAEVLAAIKK